MDCSIVVEKGEYLHLAFHAPRALSPAEEVAVLKQPGTMRGLYLGCCLDSCRWGSEVTVKWDMTPREMAGFVDYWIQQNPGTYAQLFHKILAGDNIKLPYRGVIDHSHCPRDAKHNEIINDGAGRIRCAHVEHERISSRAYAFETEDSLTKLSVLEYIDKFAPALELVVLHEPCYAIIKDLRKPVLALETVIARLRLPSSMPYYKEHSEFPFDGWKLAHYVEKWHQQQSAPLYETDAKSA